MSEPGLMTIENRIDTGIRIVRADPRVWIAREFWEACIRPNKLPEMYVEGDVLTVTDDYGAKFIYLVSEEPTAAHANCVLAEWPD